MLAIRCAPELGSDRWPRRCVSPDTTWRFCVRCGSLCLCSCSADVLHMGCRRVVCLYGTTRGRRQPHRVEDLGLTPEAQGGAAEALRTPAPCVRSTLPPCPATFLSLAQASTSGLATRPVVDADAGRGIGAHMTPRPPIGAERPGASFGERGQRPAQIWSWCGQRRRLQHLQPPPAVEPRPQQSSVRPARAPLAARAAVTVAATSAKSVGDSRSRTSRSPPTCARSTAPSLTI